MKRGTHPPDLTLGVAPTTRGFAWIAFSGPLHPYDWGMVFVRSDKNERCLRHFERLLDRIEPTVVVMEKATTKVFRSGRMQELHRSWRLTALKRDIEVATYGRGSVQACFEVLGARTNQEIAEVIARHVQDLAHKLPRKRVAWRSEDRRLALFGAAALVIAHFHFSGIKFLRDMREAA